MFWHFVWVITSFFAVIGLLFCVLSVFEFFSYHRMRSVRRITLRVELQGEEKNAEYLINSLSLLCGKVDYGQRETRLELVDAGLSAESVREICAYCKKNPWVRFTEEQ